MKIQFSEITLTIGMMILSFLLPFFSAWLRITTGSKALGAFSIVMGLILIIVFSDMAKNRLVKSGPSEQ